VPELFFFAFFFSFFFFFFFSFRSSFFFFFFLSHRGHLHSGTRVVVALSRPGPPIAGFQRFAIALGFPKAPQRYRDRGPTPTFAEKGGIRQVYLPTSDEVVRTGPNDFSRRRIAAGSCCHLKGVLKNQRALADRTTKAAFRLDPNGRAANSSSRGKRL